LDAILATARIRGEPVFLPIEVSEAIAARHPLYLSEEIPGSAFTSSPARPDDTVETVGVNHLIVTPKTLSETTIATFTRQLVAARPALAKEMPYAQERKAGYRQGCRNPRAPRCRRLYRRQ
jgi:TRAP-type uncharacterized transport system substrate-binding protein